MKKIRTFIVYFPILLVACQVLVNLLSFVAGDVYMKIGFYLNTFFGTNVLFAVFLVAFTYSFRFCAVSRWSSVAELLFASAYMIIQQDNLYNIVFQIIVGSTALIITLRYYTHKFPLCSLGNTVRFFKYVFRKRSCSKGLEMWEQETKSLILKKHLNGGH